MEGTMVVERLGGKMRVCKNGVEMWRVLGGECDHNVSYTCMIL